MAWNKSTSETTTYLDYGFLPPTGSAARTVMVKFKTSSTAAQNWLWGYGGTATNTRFSALIIQTAGAFSYVYMISISGTNYYGSTTENLNDGNWHAIVSGVPTGGRLLDSTHHIDGVSQSNVVDTDPNANTGTTHDFTVGMDPNNPLAGGANDFAEIAWWDVDLPSEQKLMLSTGKYSPLFVPNGRIMYSDLKRSHLDVIGSAATITENGANGSVSTHPPIIQPSAQILQFPTLVAAGFVPYPHPRGLSGGNLQVNGGMQ